MLGIAPESHTSGAPKKIARDHFIREKRGPNDDQQKYTPKRRARKLPFGQSNGERLMRLPWCTVVSGQIDLNTGGARIKAYPLVRL